MQDIRIALGQIRCRTGEFEANLASHRRMTLRAAAAGARIICFPECSLTGYPMTDGAFAGLAQPLDGEWAQAIAALSGETGVMILAGLVEQAADGAVHNTHLVAHQGRPAGFYRKAHLSTPEARFFRPGQALPVFRLDELTFGIQICYDNHFPEAARVLTLQGAEVIFSAFASPGPATPAGLAAKRERWLRYLTARAFDNSAYILAVNQVGSNGETPPADPPPSGAAGQADSPRDCHCGMTEFPGGTLALNPWGEMMTDLPEPVEDLLLVDLTRAYLEEKRQDDLQDFARHRRPDIYGSLVQKLKSEILMPGPQKTQ